MSLPIVPSGVSLTERPDASRSGPGGACVWHARPATLRSRYSSRVEL